MRDWAVCKISEPIFLRIEEYYISSFRVYRYKIYRPVQCQRSEHVVVKT